MTKMTRKNNKRSTNYPIGDFLTRIKNAGLACRHEVIIPKTKLIKAVAEVLKKEGYLNEVKEEEGEVIVRLAYEHKEPILLNLRLVSKPGLRVYRGVDELEQIKGPSIFILSTPQGVMTSREAIKKRVGGEILVEIW